MSENFLAAIIAAVVSLSTAIVTAYISWTQIARERDKWQQQLSNERVKWLTEVKADYQVELLKARLQAYPDIFSIIGELSTRASQQLTPQRAKEIATKINTWLYSSGGLLASKEARGALTGLREVCFEWKQEPATSDTYRDAHNQLYGFRNYSLLLLRRDVDVKGLESYDFDQLKSVLDELKEEIDGLNQSN